MYKSAARIIRLIKNGGFLAVSNLHNNELIKHAIVKMFAVYKR